MLANLFHAEIKASIALFLKCSIKYIVHVKYDKLMWSSLVTSLVTSSIVHFFRTDSYYENQTNPDWCRTRHR